VYAEIGTIYAKHDRFGEALEAFATAEKLDPNYALTFANRGGVYEKKQQYLAAIENYQRALSLDSSIQAAAAGLARSQQHVHYR